MTMSSRGWEKSSEVIVPPQNLAALMAILNPPAPTPTKEKAFAFGEVRLAIASILSAFDAQTVGSKVTKVDEFLAAVASAILGHDFAADRQPGQGFLPLPATAFGLVSAGVGRRTDNPNDYVVRANRGRVNAYLARRLAAPVESLAVVVYTAAAYAADPEAQADEVTRVTKLGATHVVVAVLASAGPKAPLTPTRLLANLAGGNREAQAWTADEIRAKAKEVADYDNAWCVVAD